MSDPTELSTATESTAITLPTTQATSQTSTTANNNRKKRRKKPPTNQTLSQFPIRKPEWTYIHLQHISSSTTASLDAVTAHLHLTAALSTYLGLHGTAIPIDILKLEGREIWIRVPAEDRAALIAAVGGWVSGNGEGWRVRGWSHWNASGVGRDGGKDLFGD